MARRLTWALVLSILGAAFLPVAFVRMVDSDEGAFLIASDLVLHGKLPYHDFSYQHTPLMAYLYAAWMKLFGVSWYSGRLLSALLAIALGVAVYRQAVRVTGRVGVGLLATILFAESGVGFSWYPTVKTLGLATLLLFLSNSVLDWGPPRAKYFLSGLFLGLSVDTRIYVIVVLLVLAIEVVRREPGRTGLRQLGWLVGGLALALAPNLFFFLIDPDTFIFNVVGHHVIRSGGVGAVGDLWQKASTVLLLLTVHGSEGATSLQFTILFVLNLAFVVSRLAFRERFPPSTSITLLLWLVSILPTPTFTQYVCLPLPFMIVNVALLIVDLERELKAVADTTAVRRRLQHVLWLLVGLYVVAAPADLYRFIVGWDAPPLHHVDDWKLPTIRRVARAIDEELPADNATVITWWPGYVIGTKASILPGLENHLNLWYSPALTAEEIGRYHYISAPALAWHIAHHTARVAVLGIFLFDTKPRWRQVLVDAGYVMVRQIGDTEIYRWDRRP